MVVLTYPALASENIATCNGLAGYAYYHHAGVWPKEQSGFSDDAIPEGLTTLVKLGDNEYDIMFTDARKNIISHRHDGGSVTLLRHGKADATFLVFYPSANIELYTFYRGKGGDARFDVLLLTFSTPQPLSSANCRSNRVLPELRDRSTKRVCGTTAQPHRWLSEARSGCLLALSLNGHRALPV